MIQILVKQVVVGCILTRNAGKVAALRGKVGTLTTLLVLLQATGTEEKAQRNAAEGIRFLP